MKESTYDISIKTTEVRRQKIIFKVVIENNSNIKFYTQLKYHSKNDCKSFQTTKYKNNSSQADKN